MAEYSFYHKRLRPWPNKRLDYSLIVGATTHKTAKVWLRTKSEGKFTLFYFPDSALAGATEEARLKERERLLPAGDLKRAEFPGFAKTVDVTTSYVSDATMVVTLTGLAADTRYHLALWSKDLDKLVFGQDHASGFRTMSADLAAPTAFVFFSCHMPFVDGPYGDPEVKDMSLWRCLRLVMKSPEYEDIRFCIAGGDQVYADGVDGLNLWKYLDSRSQVRDGHGPLVGRLEPPVSAMVSWYRDTYRGYWGFGDVLRQFSSCPTYMIWDDHEIGDGWGSFYHGGKREEMDERLPETLKRFKPRGKRQALQLCHAYLDKMRAAANQVYGEYQHSHNPDTPAGQWDYGFYAGDCAVYVLDGRGHRDVNRDSWRILGREQYDRFAAWLASAETRSRPFLFVVSAVPVIHFRESVAGLENTILADLGDVQDDLRDHWEHDLHDDERRALLRLLFAQSAAGQKVTILSGDVHIAAAFRLENDAGQRLYQVTSSAITYNVSRLGGWIMKLGVPQSGKTQDGYRFSRLTVHSARNFSVIRTRAAESAVEVDLFSQVSMSGADGEPTDGVKQPIPLTRLTLDFHR